jgi:hypothetical protein
MVNIVTHAGLGLIAATPFLGSQPALAKAAFYTTENSEKPRLVR